MSLREVWVTQEGVDLVDSSWVYLPESPWSRVMRKKVQSKSCKVETNSKWLQMSRQRQGLGRLWQAVWVIPLKYPHKVRLPYISCYLLRLITFSSKITHRHHIMGHWRGIGIPMTFEHTIIISTSCQVLSSSSRRTRRNVGNKLEENGKMSPIRNLSNQIRRLIVWYEGKDWRGLEPTPLQMSNQD